MLLLFLVLSYWCPYNPLKVMTAILNSPVSSCSVFLDYKRARTELKKRSTDTLRLQKKMRKGAGGDVQKRFECGLQDVTERRQLLEETEKHAVRAALIEERGRFCTFVGLLKPVVVSKRFITSETCF